MENMVHTRLSPWRILKEKLELLDKQIVVGVLEDM